MLREYDTTELDITNHLCCPADPPSHALKEYVKGFHGKCIGDSFASIRHDALRIIALQVAGRINDIQAWVSDTCSQIRRSGSHIVVLTETRIQTADKHNLIVNAFRKKGFLAISHNAAPPQSKARSLSSASDEPLCDPEFGPRSAGVILLVSSKYVSGWTNILHDLHGRAMAASLVLRDGATIRIIGVYGVTGASCTNFLSFPSKVKAEALLNEFLIQQFKICEQFGFHAVVAGDLNSYQKPEVDHIGGPSAIRIDCVTSMLASHGFQDSFRQRHPLVVAFTHLSGAGGSRLDQIWTKPADGLIMLTAGSCIIWQWDTHSDHCPAVVDLICEIPVIDYSVPLPHLPPWRAFMSKLNDDVYRKSVILRVAESISLNQQLIEAHRAILASLRGTFASETPSDPFSCTSRHRECLPFHRR